MSSSDRPRGEPGAARRDTTSTGTASPPAAADPYANWLDRMQRARTRHAAITKNLYSWSNYKTWADKVKVSWDDEEKGEKDKKG
jgi:hypothetical protein